MKKYYCKECGKWLGEVDDNKCLEGIYPYCHRCKKNVAITTNQEECNKLKYKCRSANL